MASDTPTPTDDVIAMMSMRRTSFAESDAAAPCYNSSSKVDDDEMTHRLSAMLCRERSFRRRRVDYVRRHDDDDDEDDRRKSEHEEEEHRESRRKMHDWCLRLCDAAGLSRLSASRAMDVLDRCLGAAFESSSSSLSSSSDLAALRRAVHDKREYQLLSMTCLYVAIKVHETTEVSAEAFAEISAGCYVAQEIVEMEMMILRALDWRIIGPPSSQEYACLLIDRAWFGRDSETFQNLLDACMSRCEYASGDYDLSMMFDPSVVGLAAVVDGLEELASSGRGDRSPHEFQVGASLDLTSVVDRVRMRLPRSSSDVSSCPVDSRRRPRRRAPLATRVREDEVVAAGSTSTMRPRSRTRRGGRRARVIEAKERHSSSPVSVGVGATGATVSP